MVVVDTRYLYTSRTASTLDELAILDQMGRRGWELIDLGPASLYFRRPRDPAAATPWEYARRTVVMGNGGREEMRARQWEPAGDWALFRYFKRQRQEQRA